MQSSSLPLHRSYSSPPRHGGASPMGPFSYKSSYGFSGPPSYDLKDIKPRGFPLPGSSLPAPQSFTSASSLPPPARAGSDIPPSLSRVVHATPSTFCSKCGATRIDIRLKCCGSGYHSRCMYPWPCTTCPTCRRAVTGIEMLPLEPFTRNGEHIEVSEKIATQTRGGRWSDAELKYAEAVIEGFMMGVLPIREGTRLGTLLCNLLQCTSARLSSKLKTGKKCFKYTMTPTQGELTKCDKLQRELSEKEELFLYYLAPEDAAATSQRLQMEWRAHFLHLAQWLGQEIDNMHTWTSILKDHMQNDSTVGAKGEGSGQRSQAVSPASHHPLRGLASMLVRMAVDRRNHYSPRQSGAATFDDLLKHMSAGPPDELSLLARAHHGSILFASAGLKQSLSLEDADILGAWLNRPSGLLHPDDVSLLEQLCRQSQVDVRSLMDRLGNPQVLLTDEDVTVRTVPLRLQRRDGSFLERRFVIVCTEDFLLLHGAHTQQPQHHRSSSTNSFGEEQDLTLDSVGSGGHSFKSGGTGDAMMGGSVLEEDIRTIEAALPDELAMMDMDDDYPDMAGMDFMDAIPIASTSTSGHTSSALLPSVSNLLRSSMSSTIQQQNACGGAYDLYYSPPASFEQTMRAFLRDVPFEAVDIWVPMTDSSGRLWLQFGGGLAMRPDLYDWVYYSRSFCFYEGEGMPGRVFRSQQSEYQDDIALLDRNLFLRRDGALANGVRTCFGVPVVQGRHVFVLVFYASRAIHMAKEVQDYIRQQISTWRIEATALGSDDQPAPPPVPPPAHQGATLPLLAPLTWPEDEAPSRHSSSSSWDGGS